MATLFTLLAIIVIAILWFISVYNGLVVRRNRVREAWSDIDVQLKRRYDLIPNLIETVKGYAAHEKSVFENVTEARGRAIGAQGKMEKAGAENALSDTLKSLFAVAENYPQLKANENFLELQRELTDTENKIQSARRFYNGVVLEFNNAIQVFPTNMVSNMLGFKQEEFFGLENEAAKEPVKVKF